MAKILWLHSLGDPKTQRLSVSTLEQCLSSSRYGRGHEVLIHDAKVSVPSSIRRIRWDGIVLGPTFLCARYGVSTLKKTRRRFDWIAESPALKIALPQDDYDCSAILDQWLVEWNVDVCYSVLPKFWDLLYPKFATKGNLLPSYTGFVDEDWVKPLNKLRSSRERQWDVVYRASRLPANFGSLGLLKSEIAGRFVSAASVCRANLRLDIQTGAEVLSGGSWHDFLGNSRFTLATPSGSSLLDEDGRHRKCVARKEAHLAFELVANECFPGEDRLYSFEALAPRHLEACLLGTVQLAVPGDYSGILEPGVHYISLEQDLSNIDHVLEQMNDAKLVTEIKAAAYERVTSDESLRLNSFASGLLHLINGRSQTGGKSRPPSEGRESSMAALERSVVRKSRIFWAPKRVRSAAVSVLDFFGLRHPLRTMRDIFRSRR